jgi:hypothetical protein
MSCPRKTVGAPVPETSSSEVLSTLSGVLGAVGLVTGKPTAVGGNKGIDELLQLPDAREVVQVKWERSSEGTSHQRVHRLGCAVASAIGCYGPGARPALFEVESYRGGSATLLEGHRRHATVAIERLK